MNLPVEEEMYGKKSSGDEMEYYADELGILFDKEGMEQWHSEILDEVEGMEMVAIFYRKQVDAYIISKRS